MGLLVGAPPGDAEDVGDEALGEAVPADHLLRAGAALGGEADDLAAVYRDEPVTQEPLEHARDGGRRDLEPIGETDGYRVQAFVIVKAIDGGEVVVAGDVRDLFGHAWHGATR